MEFLKHRLEEITIHKLEIISMNEFMKSLCNSSSQATKERTNNFLSKWGKDAYLKSVQLAYISGSWGPLCLPTKVLRFQRPWEEYLRLNYFSSLINTTIGKSSPGFKPFNFKELVQMPFWKELYETFGQKTVGFIFDKSLIIVKVEENFFLSIASESSILGQKLAKTVTRKRNISGTNVRESMNPYSKLELGEKEVPTSNSKDTHVRKRCRLTLDDLNEEFRQKIQIEQKSQMQDIEIPKNSHGIIRWFIPTDKILRFVIEEREKLKAVNGISSVVHAIPGGITEINYIGIVEDEKFLKIAGQDIGAILKESCKIKFPLKKLPPQWEGLKISDELSKPTTYAYINVFKISETFAKKHAIRIKTKQRRKKKSQHENLDSSNLKNQEAINDCENSKATESQPYQTTTTTTSLPNYQSSIQGKPFNPFILLETLPALYNKCSWSRWPQKHILTVACNAAAGNHSPNLLLENILNTDAGASINGQISQFLLPSKIDDLKDLRTILGEIITYHRRVRDIHRLVKGCLTFWVMKKQTKLNKREERTQHKSLMISTNLTKNKSIEMIDLTINTPSTGDSFPESHSKISNLTALEFSLNTVSGGDINNSSTIQINKPPCIKQQRAFAYEKLKDKIPHTCLSMALKQVFHVCKINKLLGSKKNVRGFFTFLRKSIILAGTKSALQLGQLMALLDPNDCEWLKLVQDPMYKYAILAKVATWLFTNYVIVILKTSFYITETSESRLHTSFYLRESWKSIDEQVKDRFIKSGGLRKVTSTSMSQQRQPDSINATVRFLPKKNRDLRPILALKRKSLSYDSSDLRRWTMVINLLVKQFSPHRLRDTNLMRHRWSQFLQHWKRMHCPKLWYVHADIKDAYPSVDIKKLQDTLRNLSQNLGELTSKDFRVISSSRVVNRETLLNKGNREQWNSSILARPCIVQDLNRKGSESNARDVANEVASCFKQSIVRIGKHEYSFEYGLPQGWKLSEGLCNIYYGDMDAKHLSKFLNKKGEFLMTSVDDYLYITFDPIRASKFYKKMQAGMPDFGCKINNKKIFSNIHPPSHVESPQQECEWVNFCGWKFCLTCGHMMRDFTSYKDQDMASSLSFYPRNVTSPENFLMSRMKIMLPARLQLFLLDPAINCRNRIILNVYDAGLIFAFRFYAICRVIFSNLNAVKEPRRAVHIVSAIYKCTKILSKVIANSFRCTYPAKPAPMKCTIKNGKTMCSCIKSYNKTKGKNVKAVDDASWMDQPLEEAEIFYVVYHAFILKLQKHSQVFKDEILPKIHKMHHHQKSMLSPGKVECLTNLLGNCMPSHFEDIRI